MEQLKIIVEGLGTGFALSLMLGTVFFALLQSSITYGFKTGLAIATGVVVCDIVFITLALWSTSFAGFLKDYSKTVAVVGGIVLIALGISMFLKKQKASNPILVSSNRLGRIIYFFGTGFLLNLLNPVNFFSWLGISTMLTVRFQYGINQQLLFFSASLVAIWITEFLIAYFASRIKILATPNALLWVNRVSGIVFIVVGIRLLFT